jgi:hypothetical protein
MKAKTKKPKQPERSPYKCPECGNRLIDVGGYWGCLCRGGFDRRRPVKVAPLPTGLLIRALSNAGSIERIPDLPPVIDAWKRSHPER